MEDHEEEPARLQKRIADLERLLSLAQQDLHRADLLICELSHAEATLREDLQALRREKAGGE